MSLTKFTEILNNLGCETEIDGDELLIDIDQNKIRVQIEDSWKRSINHFFRAKQYQFDKQSRMLVANQFVEYQIVRLDPNFIPRPEFEFKDDKGGAVTVTKASDEYLLSFFSSEAYLDIFSIIKNRIQRRCENRRPRRDGRVRMGIDEILIIPYTATYTPKPKISKDKLPEIGREKIKACLFNLVFAKDECWELRDEIKSKYFSYKRHELEDDELVIPSVKYEDDLVSFYKVAMSSQFPGQSYLSFYHVLEYNFLRVADEILFNSVKTQLNRPNYKPTYSNVNKLLSIIKKHDKHQDETEMLKAVLNKYVQEEELIDYIKKLESDSDEKIFSNPKAVIFGEKMSIKLESGHALSNTAKVVKHIRNSLVHSSDRYSREDCFMPFSESESVVSKYIPIVQFLAESVIFSTAS